MSRISSKFTVTVIYIVGKMFKNCCGCKNSKANKKDDEVDKKGDSYGPKQTQDTKLPDGADAADKKIKSPVKTSDTLKIVPLPNVTITEPDDVPVKSSQDERKPETDTQDSENKGREELEKEKQTSETKRNYTKDETVTYSVEGKRDETRSFVPDEKLLADTIELLMKEEEIGGRSRLPSEDEVDTVTLQATPYPAKRSSGGVPNLAALPQWLSQEDDDAVAEGGGTAEPPATPVGRDELALRRHRFFSDLLQAHQAGAEHRVRFDPLGPTVAGGEYLRAAICSENLKSLFSSISGT